MSLQLLQVDTTLSITPNGPVRDNLLSLKSDIEELISLTRESLQSLEGDNEENTNEDEDFDDDTQDPMDKEYALFKVRGHIHVYLLLELLYCIFTLSLLLVSNKLSNVSKHNLSHI